MRSVPLSIGDLPLRMSSRRATVARLRSASVKRLLSLQAGSVPGRDHCSASPGESTPDGHLQQHQQPAYGMANLGAEDHLIIAACCPDLGNTSILETICGLMLLSTRKGSVRRSQLSVRGDGAVFVSDQPIQLNGHTALDLRQEKLEPVK